MFNYINIGEICFCVKHIADNHTEADKEIEHCLCLIGNTGDKGFSSEKLEHIPQMSENNCEGCLYKFRGISVHHPPHAPHKKQQSADPPCNLLGLGEGIHCSELFHLLKIPFGDNIILYIIAQINIFGYILARII